MLAECEIWNDQLYYRQKMIVSNSDILQYKILEFAHNSTVISHSDQAKIYEIIQQAYYWFRMHDFVWQYMQEYQTCIQEKVSHKQKQEILWSILISMWWWHNILIDFVIDLLNNNEYTNIMIVIDRFIKLQYFIILEFFNVNTVVDVFIKNVFKLHELSNMIISDCVL